MLENIARANQELLEQLADMNLANRELRATIQIMRQSMERLQNGIDGAGSCLAGLEELELAFFGLKRSVRAGICDAATPGRFSREEWHAVRIMHQSFQDLLGWYMLELEGKCTYPPEKPGQDGGETNG